MYHFVEMVFHMDDFFVGIEEKMVAFFTRFHVLKKRRSSIELSNNMSERRCELKVNELVSERSELVSG